MRARHIKVTLKNFYEKACLKLYESLYPRYKNRLFTPEQHWQYSVTAEQIYGDKRQPGVSAYYRIYNEEDFLAASVESHLLFFDEIILVHDSTTIDRSPLIAQQLVKKYPDKIKYFIYEPKAFKLRTRKYRILPDYHPNSFVNYYNFALSKTTKQIVAKIDSDHIAISATFARITDNSRNIDFMQNVYYTFCGINLWYCDGKLYVDPEIIPGQHGDHGFHVMYPEKHYYKKGMRFENGYFSVKNRQLKHAGILYFHLKNMRSTISHHSWRGLSDEIHRQNFKKRFAKKRHSFVDWMTFLNNYRDIFLQKTTTDIYDLPDPNIYLQDLLKKIPSLSTDDLMK